MRIFERNSHEDCKTGFKDFTSCKMGLGDASYTRWFLGISCIFCFLCPRRPDSTKAPFCLNLVWVPAFWEESDEKGAVWVVFGVFSLALLDLIFHTPLVAEP